MNLPENVRAARRAAIKILKHNAVGPCEDLPRTAGWGYPEPYTRDLMISLPGFLLTGDTECVAQMRRTLEYLAKNQTERGHIPSLAHDTDHRGASDTTPLFLFGLSIFRQHVGEPQFLQVAADKAITWMRYQSDDDRGMVTQLPTSDWRDEQWVFGYGLFVNTVCYAYLRQHQLHSEASALSDLINRFDIVEPDPRHHVHAGLALPNKPYYAICTYKIYHDQRFDLLGNSLAILFGIASPARSQELITWIEGECSAMRARGELALELPPCLLPFIRPGDQDWLPRYERFNQPGEYHNGGIWPFICGLYIAACVAIGKNDLALTRLEALARAVQPWHEDAADWGFNEQLKAQTGAPIGRDWQTWSAALFVYAAFCVETETTPWLDTIRSERGRS